MKSMKRVALIGFSIITLAIVVELVSSKLSSVQGPFKYFADAPGEGDVIERAKNAIAQYFSTKRDQVEAENFLTGAGFSCEKWSRDLVEKRRVYARGASTGIICNYYYGRYFMYANNWVVSVPFDASGNSLSPEIVWVS
jgi:hypothetical protein